MEQSLDELNKKAEKLFNEGNRTEIEKLVKENGLDPYLVDMYMHGELMALCPDEATLAVGKLDKEVAEYKSMPELAEGIAEYLKQQVQVDDLLAKGVVAKPLKELCDKVYEEAKKRKKGSCAYIPPFEVFQMAKAYYLEVQE